MEELRNEVAGADVGQGNARPIGQTLEFLFIPPGEELLLGGLYQLDDRLRAHYRQARHLDLHVLHLLVEQVSHDGMHPVAKQPAVLEADLVW